MTVIVTDVHYRMSLALIRDMGDIGASVVACERKKYAHAALGFVSCYTKYSVTLPDEGYADALYALCLEVHQKAGQKPVLFCVGAQTLALVAEQSDRFAEIAHFLIPSTQQLTLLNDKAAVAALAGRVGVKTPESFVRGLEETEEDFAARVRYPCVVKPVCGEKFGLAAAERYRIVRDAETLINSVRHFRNITGEPPLVQEYLPGKSAGCSVVAQNGKILGSICHQRIREYPISGGPSSCCKVIAGEELMEAVSALVSEIALSGVAMFEFKAAADGSWRLLEVNPRVWGTFPLTRVSGSNFSAVWLAAASGNTIPVFRKPDAKKMVFYPSDFAALWGYLKNGRPGKFFGGVLDFLNPCVKNGIRDSRDTKPARLYWKTLRQRGKQK